MVIAYREVKPRGCMQDTEYWKNPENGRYYIAVQIKDLFGYHTIVVANGGEKIKHRRYTAIYASKIKDEVQEKIILDEITKKREARKYLPHKIFNSNNPNKVE